MYCYLTHSVCIQNERILKENFFTYQFLIIQFVYAYNGIIIHHDQMLEIRSNQLYFLNVP